MGGIRGVLLDLDGTLIDHRTAADLAALEWAQRLRVPVDGRPAERWRTLEERFYPLFERGQCSLVEQRRLRVRAFAADLADLTDAEADALFDSYLMLYRANWSAFPGAAELIDRALAAGCRVGVLTNGQEAQQAEKLAATGLKRSELRLFASSVLGCAKPAARAFALACAGMGTLPAETVMVGDDANNDVVGARVAGLRAIHVSHDAAGVAGGALRSLREVADTLFGAV